MVDYSIFDNLLDSVFVVDSDGKVVYCNEAGASLFQSSVRRLMGKALFHEVISFSEESILPITKDTPGYETPSALIETAYTLPKAEKFGKTQLTIRPAAPGHWIFFMHDVSLEETLAAKYRAELAKTEEYARNLEKLVDARTIELRDVNQTLNAILNSLGQGFFTFNPDGECGDVFTKACEEILEGIPKARKAWDVLGVPERELTQFQKWMETAFKEYLPFEDVKGLGPNLYAHKHQKYVTLDYFPIRREKADGISDIVVVATDKTVEHQAQLALETERQYAAMVVKFLKNKEQFLEFLNSIQKTLQDLSALCGEPLNSQTINESFRLLHTLEGEAGTFSMNEMRQLARASQHVLEPFKVAGLIPADAQQAYTETLLDLQAHYSKFLSENESIFQLSAGEAARTVEVPATAVQEFGAQLDHAPAPLRMKFRELFLRVPIGSRLKYFDGLLQSVAEKLGKQVKPLIIEGGDIRIFPEPYQALFSNLVHAFRNAADHGLEEPTEREWAGKSSAGQVRVRVREDQLGLHLEISDDGRGIDPAVIREKLKTKFPDKDFSSQSDEEIIQSVALPGFSSRDTVGEFSGRGVGLDALREEVLSLGGTFHIKSIVGKGTTLEICIPEFEETEVRRSA